VRITRAALSAVLAVGVFVAPGAVEGQEPGKVARVGILARRTRSDAAPFIDAFVRGMRELGWVEGKTVAFEFRFAEGQLDRLPDLAAELVRLKVDVILAASTPPAVASRNATRTIPIVIAAGADPVALGLVASVARPGENVTGLAYDVDLQIPTKALELLKEALPKVQRVAMLWNPSNPGHAVTVKRIKAGAPPAVQLQFLPARGPDQFETAFAAMARQRAEALLVVPDSLFGLNRSRLQGFVSKSRLPTMFGSREHAEGSDELLGGYP
jgi:putative ABC transport system substrate-binding protein